jgi:hypothetical protein
MNVDLVMCCYVLRGIQNHVGATQNYICMCQVCIRLVKKRARNVEVDVFCLRQTLGDLAVVLSAARFATHMTVTIKFVCEVSKFCCTVFSVYSFPF